MVVLYHALFFDLYYFTNGESNDGIIYKLNLTGPDSGELEETDDKNFNNRNFIFLFNTLEQNSYSK